MTKLLIVDDEPFTVDMLQTFLQLNGFETFGAFNGEDGLVLVKVEQPEVVILDLMLPDIEGYEVCQRIRNFPDSAALPVVILSARAEAASKERAMAAGADAYLVKPVQFPQLLTEVNRLLTEKRAQIVAQSATPAPVPPAETKPAETPAASTPTPAPAAPAAPTTPVIPPAWIAPVEAKPEAPTPPATPVQTAPSPAVPARPEDTSVSGTGDKPVNNTPGSTTQPGS